MGFGLPLRAWAPFSDWAHILCANPSAPYALATAQQRGELADRGVGREESDEQRDREVASLLTGRAPAVRDEAVVLFIEPQRVLGPTDSNITPHLSLPHGESLGGRNIRRPSRPQTEALLYERHLWRRAGIIPTNDRGPSARLTLGPGHRAAQHRPVIDAQSDLLLNL